MTEPSMDGLMRGQNGMILAVPSKAWRYLDTNDDASTEGAPS
jgi:hypothetical protein